MATEKSEIEQMQAAVATSLHAHWGLFLAEGIILLILGGAAIVLPLTATFAVEINPESWPMASMPLFNRFP